MNEHREDRNGQRAAARLEMAFNRQGVGGLKSKCQELPEPSAVSGPLGFD